MLRSWRVAVFARSSVKFELSFGHASRPGYRHLSHESLRSVQFSKKIEISTKLCRSKIHTTRKLDVPPILALILRPLVNVGAFLFGRYFKRWWAKQTPAQKEMFKKWLISKRGVFLGIFGTFLSGVGIYYVWHLETDPLTRRRRLIILNEKQQDTLAKLGYEMQLEEHKNNLIPHHHPVFVRVLRVVRKLLNANTDLPFVANESWTLNVINEDTINAYVMAGGHIFVYVGILNFVENDDQLATILSHEIAHVILKHSIEQISYGVLFDILLAIPLAVLWAMFPDLLAFFLQDFIKSLIAVVLKLPYSRALEMEADEVGLNLAAKACVDVREAVVFWSMMKAASDVKTSTSEVPWLSTHPENEERSKFLDARIPEALKLRLQSGCTKVSPVDPRIRFNERLKKEKESSKLHEIASKSIVEI